MRAKRVSFFQDFCVSHYITMNSLRSQHFKMRIWDDFEWFSYTVIIPPLTIQFLQVYPVSGFDYCLDFVFYSRKAAFYFFPQGESYQIFMQIARSLHWYISHFRWVGTVLRGASCPPREARASWRISPAIIQADLQALKVRLKKKRFLGLWAPLKSPSPPKTIKATESFSNLAYLTVRKDFWSKAERSLLLISKVGLGNSSWEKFGPFGD